MAVVKLNPGYENIRWSKGNLVLKHYARVTVLSRKPVFTNRRFTEAQKACQARFREAALFAKRLMEDPRARAVYEEEARLKGKPARSLIIADYLHAPSGHEIDISSCKCSHDSPSNLDKRHPPACAVAGPLNGVRRERWHVPNNDSAFASRVWRQTRDELKNSSYKAWSEEHLRPPPGRSRKLQLAILPVTRYGAGSERCKEKACRGSGSRLTYT